MGNTTEITNKTTANDNITYSSEDLESDDFPTIFHNLGMPEKDANKISNEYGDWNTFITQYHEDTPDTLKYIKLSQKSISISMFARYKVLFDDASLYDIANMNVDYKTISSFCSRLKRSIINETVEIPPRCKYPTYSWESPIDIQEHRDKLFNAIHDIMIFYAIHAPDENQTVLLKYHQKQSASVNNEPYENVDPDAFVNVVDIVAHHVLDSTDSSASYSLCPKDSFIVNSNASYDDDAIVHDFDHFSNYQFITLLNMSSALQ